MKNSPLRFFQLQAAILRSSKIAIMPFIIFAFLFISQVSFGAEPSIPMLKQITQAGGSLIVDLDKQSYTVSQLLDLASSLKFQATLTIKMGQSHLSATQCAQIARARPGQVVFWF